MLPDEAELKSANIEVYRPFAREPLSGTSGRVAVGNDDHWKRVTISAVDL